MKKIFLTLAVAAIAAAGAPAQNVVQAFKDVEYSGSDNKQFFGVRVGFDVPCPTKMGYHEDHVTSKMSMLNTGFGLTIGGIYNLPVWENLYFEPGVGLFYRTNKYNRNFIDAVSNELNIDLEEGHVNEFGLTVPLMFGYRFYFDGFSLGVFTGPEFQLGLYGRNKLSTKSKGTTISVSESAYLDGNFNRGNIFWRFGVNAQFAEHWVVSLSGAPGLTNRLKDVDHTSMRMNVVTVGLGYNF